MALQPEQSPDTGMWGLRGVTSEESSLAPLGRFYWQLGPHFLGVDDAFTDPVVVRAYYDPSQDKTNLLPRDAYLAGYMQFVQVSFLGTPVSPVAYGGRLSDREPYVADDFTFVDFMGPADACVRVDAELRRLDPFYAWNGALLDGTINRYTDLAIHPRPNGVFILNDQSLGPQQARCASLVAEVSPGLVTEGVIAKLLSNDNLLYKVPCEPHQLGSNEAYEIALKHMADENDLPGLSYDDVAGQAIGKYALITLPNEEAMPPVICVYVADDRQAVHVHIIAYHEMESAEEVAVMQSLQRMSEYIKNGDENLMDIEDADISSGGRGTRGLDNIPYILTPGERHIEWKYWTFLMAQIPARSTRNNPYVDILPIHGFTWSAWQTFDPDMRTLTLSEIQRPLELITFNKRAALIKYYETINRYLNGSIARPRIDVSNFTLAAMRRRNMAAGVKLSGINLDGSSANNKDGSPAA